MGALQPVNHYTTEDLLQMRRLDLLRVAARLGIRVAGRPTALLVNDVLLRQAEVLAREVTPESTRIAVLEDSVARLEQALLEQGVMISEMYSALSLLALDHGVPLHAALKALAVKFKTRMRLAAMGSAVAGSKPE